MTVPEVAALFAVLLELDEVEPEDNFFDLGGSSMLALRLLGEIEQNTGVQLGLIDLVRNATAAGLTARLAEVRATAKTGS